MLRRFVVSQGLVSCCEVIAMQLVRCGTPGAPAKAVPYDPLTWPKSCTATEIKDLLRDALLTPHVPPNYESLAYLHKNGDIKSLTALLRLCIKPPMPKAVDLEAYLARNLSGSWDPASMPLQEREPQLDKVADGLSRSPGSDKRNVVCCYSPRGSGKTQFIKRFVLTKRAEAMKYGRVIVRCCDQASGSPWMRRVLDDSMTKLQHFDNQMSFATATTVSHDGLCMLVREHVETVTGRVQNASDYCDSKSAYTTWISETERHFDIPPTTENVDPLIILDTCEFLEREHKTLRRSSGKAHTLLENFALSVPSPYSIAFFGCNAKITADPVLLTQANLHTITSLAPLTEDGFKKALTESWKIDINADFAKLVYYWAGGVSRLLRAGAHEGLRTVFASRLTSQSTHTAFDVFRVAAMSQYPLVDRTLPFAYSCMLASSTKARIRGGDIIPLNPAWKVTRNCTYDDAMIESIGSLALSGDRFIVPPITLLDELIAVVRPTAPILPSQLYPFIGADFVACYTLLVRKEFEARFMRERVFEISFMYAVYARYLLAYWDDTKTPWVSLGKVFEGAINDLQHDIMSKYETNLSRGVVMCKASRSYQDAEKNAVMYNQVNGHHDAYIWCRDKKKKGAEFAVPMQMFRGPPQRWLGRQLQVSKFSAKKVPLLLSINQEARPVRAENEKKIVNINADEMTSVSWLWPGRSLYQRNYEE